MNGELLHAAEQVISYKTYQRAGYIPDTILTKIDSTIYRFESRPSVNSFRKPVFVESQKSWFSHLSKLGLTNISLRIREKAEDLDRLAFSNQLQDCVIETSSLEQMSVWRKFWKFDQKEQLWDIWYTEQLLDSLIPYPDIADPTSGFSLKLAEIRSISDELGYPFFSERFQRAETLLSGNILSDCPYLEMPPKNRMLYMAAREAWVFGGMGWWNDSPAYTADQRNRGELYKQLSDSLYTEIVTALMYAVNKW